MGLHKSWLQRKSGREKLHKRSSTYQGTKCSKKTYQNPPPEPWSENQIREGKSQSHRTMEAGRFGVYQNGTRQGGSTDTLGGPVREKTAREQERSRRGFHHPTPLGQGGGRGENVLWGFGSGLITGRRVFQSSAYMAPPTRGSKDTSANVQPQ